VPESEQSYIEGLLDHIVDDETTIEYALEPEENPVSESIVVINMLKDIGRKVTNMEATLSKTSGFVIQHSEKIAQLEAQTISSKKDRDRYEAEIKKLFTETSENRHVINIARSEINGLDSFHEDLERDVKELKKKMHILDGLDQQKNNLWKNTLLILGAIGGVSAGFASIYLALR